MEVKVKIIVELGDNTMAVISKLFSSLSVPDTKTVKQTKAVTLETLIDKVRELTESGFHIEIKKLLENYDVDRVNNLSQTSYKSFYNKLLKIKNHDIHK